MQELKRALDRIVPSWRPKVLFAEPVLQSAGSLLWKTQDVRRFRGWAQ